MIELQIASTRILIAPDPGIRLHKLESAYSSFLIDPKSPTGRDPADLSLHIRVRKGEMPGLALFQKVFTTDESWSFYRRGSIQAISLDPPHRKIPFWTARFDSGLRRVTVFLSPSSESRAPSALPNPVSYPLDQLLLMSLLARHRGFLVHGAGMIFRGRMLLFVGSSGAGKSTLAKLLKERWPRSVASDERMVVRLRKGEWQAYGTPWPGTADIARNIRAPLDSILFLRHGRENRVVDLEPEVAFQRLLPICSIPWYDERMMPRILRTCRDLTRSLPARDLSFVPDSSAVDFVGKSL